MKSTERSPAAYLVAELLQAETETRHQHLTYPWADLAGCWRLEFVTGTRKLRDRGGIALGAGRYLPAWISIELAIHPPTELSSPDPSSPDQGQMVNRVQLGLLWLELNGPTRYLAKKNILAFDFTHLRIGLGGITLYNQGIRGGQAANEKFGQQPIAKLPFFAFFRVQPDRIAARGRGGGLAQWVKTGHR